jgi:hypothetical protein
MTTTAPKPAAQATDTKQPIEASATTAAPASTAAAAASADAERARIKGIVGCAEAKGREALADHLAFNTSMGVEEARGLLNAAPKQDAEPQAASNPFEAAMNASDNPNVGASAGKGEEQREDLGAALLRSYSLASGMKFKD